MGAYKNKSYAEVFASVYDNDEYMDLYHWGVYATTFLWEHHLSIYEMFQNRYLPLIPEGASSIEFGFGQIQIQ